MASRASGNENARTIISREMVSYKSSNREKERAMAKPVPLQLPARDPREELRSRLESAPLEHADALLATYEVLQGLHDSGVLEVLRGLLGSSDKVLERVVDAARAPESVHAMRNLITLIKTLGAIDPELFDGFPLPLPETLHHPTARRNHPPPFPAILHTFLS